MLLLRCAAGHGKHSALPRPHLAGSTASCFTCLSTDTVAWLLVLTSTESMGLGGQVIKAIKRKGYRLPTPIQRRTLPLILQGVDLIGMARTGSGKTAAFVIPMIEK